ncbi:hypothetical protein F2P81_012573 [Scophthalmus maximus]|uniref:Uncharacterized protein n=1 Tax=Scophthalmus maximus TaxID=52904 RepID=A0A6A4SQK5_SCOMX|nr:hypothetical protein F2P81_012573 [Scophthalmus maximus]
MDRLPNGPKGAQSICRREESVVIRHRALVTIRFNTELKSIYKSNILLEGLRCLQMSETSFTRSVLMLVGRVKNDSLGRTHREGAGEGSATRHRNSADEIVRGRGKTIQRMRRKCATQVVFCYRSLSVVFPWKRTVWQELACCKSGPVMFNMENYPVECVTADLLGPGCAAEPGAMKSHLQITADPKMTDADSASCLLSAHYAFHVYRRCSRGICGADLR